MTIEEKAKAYDEALDRAKKELQTCGSTDCDAARQIFRFFPELRESEDERIIKLIRSLLENVRNVQSNTSLYKQYDDALAWLEKRKEEEGYEAIPVESTLEYKLGFKAGKESEKQKECFADSSKTSANEDESIRKFLVDYFASYKIGNVATKLNGVRIDDILNYLEKQKEPENTSASTMIPSCWEEKQKEQKEIPLMNGDTDLYFDEWNQQHSNPTKRECFEEGMKYVQRLQKEQKPVVTHGETYHVDTLGTQQVIAGKMPQKPVERSLEDDHIIGFIYDLLNEIEWKDSWAMSKDECLRLLSNYIPEKSAEWSEEDELNCNRIIRFLEPHKTFFPKKETKEEMKNWLENRLKSLSPQPKQEWSEEDKAIVNCIACCLDGSFVPEAARKQCLEWFNKHRRDFLNSHSWKPSEHQMNILKAVKDYVGKGSGYWGEGLGSLIEDLEKLM